MFSGIVGDKGRIVAIIERSGGRLFSVQCTAAFLQNAKPGDSIAVNGACQTAEEAQCDLFTFFSSAETLSLTNLSLCRTGDSVNLERSLTLATPIDGHLVTGHVDCMGRIVSLRKDGDAYLLEVDIKRELLPLVAIKGSIAVDGTSLTVNNVMGTIVSMTVIPFTYEHTLLAMKKVGDMVNIETDILARYVANFLNKRESGDGQTLVSSLMENGFL